MSIIKRIFLSILLLAVIAYLIVAVAAFSKKPQGLLCNDIELVSVDTTETGFITKREILNLLNTSKTNPIGKDLDSINTMKMEQVIAKHPAVKRVDCYKTPSGMIGVDIAQRIPVLRIMSANGDDYFVDEEGSIIPAQRNIAHLAVVTGRVNKEFVSKELYKFGVFLQKNEFWRSQIEQINILSGNNIEFVPRVGDHLVYMGSLNGYERKLERLQKFYLKVLSEIGWNKYSTINIEFNNQIVCTKK